MCSEVKATVLLALETVSAVTNVIKYISVRCQATPKTLVYRRLTLRYTNKAKIDRKCLLKMKVVALTIKTHNNNIITKCHENNACINKYNKHNVIEFSININHIYIYTYVSVRIYIYSTCCYLVILFVCLLIVHC